MYLAGTVVRKGNKITFQCVQGNDRPYIVSIEGILKDLISTIGCGQLVVVDVYKWNNHTVNSYSRDFWVNSIISGSVNIIK